MDNTEAKIKLESDVKKQHTVPRFLLDNFGFGKKGRRRKLYTFDKKSERTYQTSVFDATTINKFYNIDNHPEKISLEPLLAIYEKKAAPVLKKIIGSASLDFLTREQRKIVATFVAVQRARSQGEYARIVDLFAKFKNRLDGFAKIDKAIENQFYGEGKVDDKELFFKQIIDQKEMIESLMNKKWILFKTNKVSPFYISDNPVTLFNNIDMGLRGNLGTEQEGIQIYLPLSSTLTLALICPLTAHTMRLNHIQKIQNKMDEGSYLTEIYDVHDAYEGKKAINLTSENVTFLNSLQVRYSETRVYCEKDKFDLVKIMLNDSDIFKIGPRMQIN